MPQQEKGRVVVLARPLLAGEQEAHSSDLHIDELSKVFWHPVRVKSADLRVIKRWKHLGARLGQYTETAAAVHMSLSKMLAI
jgi:hypothetical protein